MKSCFWGSSSQTSLAGISISNDLNLSRAVLSELGSLVVLPGRIDANAQHGWLQLFGALTETSSLCSGLPACCRFVLARGARMQQRIRAHRGKLCMLIRASLVASANSARSCFSCYFFLFVCVMGCASVALEILINLTHYFHAAALEFVAASQ